MNKNSDTSGYIKILSVILMIFVGLYLYNFPIQRIRAEKAVDEYMVRQGVDFSQIESKEVLKDYTQNGHYIHIRFKNDPEFIYAYQYKKNGDVNLIIYNQMWCSIDNWYLETPPKYPDLSE